MNGFGVVEAILSAALLSIIISYSLYFSTVRLSIIHKSQITKAINKEIQRDIERLKSDLWSVYYDNKIGSYNMSSTKAKESCLNILDTILSLKNWPKQSEQSKNKKDESKETIIYDRQYWYPDKTSHRVFKGKIVKISRELSISRPIDLKIKELDKSIAKVSYNVEWSGENIQWLNIDLTSESHSRCPHRI